MRTLRRAIPTGGREHGVSLLETTLATSVLAIALMVGVPLLKQVGDAGDEGSARVTAQSDNVEALVRIAAELQNTSATALDEAGGFRFEVVDGVAPRPLVDARSGDLGGFDGQLGDYIDETRTNEEIATPSDGGPGGPLSLTLSWSDLPIFFQETPTGGGWPRRRFGSDDPVDDFSGEHTFKRGGNRPPHAGGPGGSSGGTSGPGSSGRRGGSSGSGSGTRGGTIGRSSGLTGAVVAATDVARRPRRKAIPLNSVLRFQKVVDFAIDTAGQPQIIWSTPIEYRVEDRKLVRIQDGETRVVAPNVVAFRAELTDAGTLALTLVSQKRASSTGRISFQANQVEVNPKN